MGALQLLQENIYNELINNDILKSITFDEVPQNPTFPYISIGEATEVPQDNFGTMSEINHIIDIFDKGKGNKNALNLADIVVNILKNNCSKEEFNGYQIIYKKIEQQQIEKLFDEGTGILIRHVEIIAKFTMVKL